MSRLVVLPGKLRSRRSFKRCLIASLWLFVLHEIYSFFSSRHSNLSLNHHLNQLNPITQIHQIKSINYIKPPHPIKSRLDSARQRWSAKIKSQSNHYGQFKANYRKKYHLEPPQGMRNWFKTVTLDGVLLVDEFDELMSSLEPFRSMSPQELRQRTLDIASMPTFSLLNITGSHSYFYGQNYRGDFKHYDRENYGPGLERVEGFASMLQRHISRLPDGLTFAVSELAEPRIIVPWQDHPNTLKSFQPDTSFIQKQNYHQLLKTENLKTLLPTPAFDDSGTSWELYAKSCPPQSPTRKKLIRLRRENALAQPKDPQILNLTDPIHLKGGKAKAGLAKRRLSNLSLNLEPSNPINRPLDHQSAQLDLDSDLPNGYPTLSRLLNYSTEFQFLETGTVGLSHEKLCSDSQLHQNQGAFYSDWRSLPALYPVFSPSKIDGYSDILIPSNFYYGDDARYSFQSNETLEWKDKKNKLFWRGETTGGGNSPPGHQLQYQRHRFVRLTQRVSDNLKSILVPQPGTGFIRHVKRTITDLNNAWFDVGFTGYTGCGTPEICELTQKLFSLRKRVPLQEMAKYKAILDLDGMAFSGRFVALMNMGSGVIKSTVYKDALTDWIEPWVHYIPLSGSYSELYNLLAYFLPLNQESEKSDQNSWFQKLWSKKTNKSQFEGDQELQQVAEAGFKWSQSIGNKQDIEAYVYRLALEWARMTGLIGDEEIDPEEEMSIEPDSLFDINQPTFTYPPTKGNGLKVES
ncbi:hypothetical protein O181_065761 [Austropuccinia psidii MF-1]|uniref:Glycosyl transferase CAP10 domain-containing protein n=1 Tax=Austropuccinia psidii MF-1 TaxID=1389203 RepID=A0A9Q3I1H9_9BASI|nr:hypothetical protein [Austropuccinia psidii MF-1]